MADLSPLRRRMIEDMKVRNLSPATQRCYVHAVAKFAQHFNRSPDRLGLAEIRVYQIHLTSIGISYVFHRTGHHKLERWMSIGHISVASFGAVRNYCLESRHVY